MQDFEGVIVTEEHLAFARRIARRMVRDSSIDEAEDYVSYAALEIAKAEADGEVDVALLWVIGKHTIIEHWRTLHLQARKNKYGETIRLPKPQRLPFEEKHEPQSYDDRSLIETDLAVLRKMKERDIIKPWDILILQLVADGNNEDDMVEKLGLKLSTIRSYRKRALHVVRGRNMVHAVAIALRAGIIK